MHALPINLPCMGPHLQNHTYTSRTSPSCSQTSSWQWLHWQRIQQVRSNSILMNMTAKSHCFAFQPPVLAHSTFSLLRVTALEHLRITEHASFQLSEREMSPSTKQPSCYHGELKKYFLSSFAMEEKKARARIYALRLMHGISNAFLSIPQTFIHHYFLQRWETFS